MKNFRFTAILSAIILGAAALLVSCGNDPEPEAPIFKVDYTPENIPGSGGNATFTITSDQDWTVTAVEPGSDWIVISDPTGSGNKEVSMTVEKNDTATPREVTIRVSSGTLTPVTFKVNQNVITDLDVEYQTTDVTDVAPEGGNVFMKVKTNLAWSASIDYTDGSDWLELNLQSGQGEKDVVLFVSENEEKEPREATLTFTAEGADPFNITITQKEINYLEVQFPIGKIPYQGGTMDLTIKSNTDWELRLKDPIYDDWVKIGKETGSGDEVVTLTIERSFNETERSTLLFLGTPGSDDPARITVVQEAAPATPARPGDIQGEDENIIPDMFVTLTVEPVAGATYYVWYRNGVEVGRTDEPSYNAHEAGQYQVAAGNDTGLGKKNMNPKTISIDDGGELGWVLGRWIVTETETWVYKHVRPKPLDETTYEITITPTGNENEVVIRNLAVAEYPLIYSMYPAMGLTRAVTAYATVDNLALTLTIKFAEIEPWYPEGHNATMYLYQGDNEFTAGMVTEGRTLEPIVYSDVEGVEKLTFENGDDGTCYSIGAISNKNTTTYTKRANTVFTKKK